MNEKIEKIELLGDEEKTLLEQTVEVMKETVKLSEERMRQIEAEIKSFDKNSSNIQELLTKFNDFKNTNIIDRQKNINEKLKKYQEYMAKKQ